MLFPCRAPKGLESVFPNLHSAAVSDSHLPCHAMFRLCRSSQGHSTIRPLIDNCCGLEKNGMASVNQTWPHCVHQMGKTHSKPLAARHAMCESAFNVTLPNLVISLLPKWLQLPLYFTNSSSNYDYILLCLLIKL